MNLPQPTELNILYRHETNSRLRLEVRVSQLFDPKKPAQADITDSEQISWAGRVLSEDERQGLKEAVQQIDIQSMPHKAERIGQGSHLLTIDIPQGQASYQWWGSLPSAWQTLAPLINALASLVTHRD